MSKQRGMDEDELECKAINLLILERSAPTNEKGIPRIRSLDGSSATTLHILIARLIVAESKSQEKCYAFGLSTRSPNLSAVLLTMHIHAHEPSCSLSSNLYTSKPSPRDHRAKTLTTPSPPALTTNLPSLLQQTSQTPSPLMARWETMSCVQILFSRDQKRMLAS